MAIDYSVDDLTTIWDSQSDARTGMKKRQDYYNGEHEILERNESWADGNKKTNRVVNWIKFAVDLYVGALTSATFQIASDAAPSEELTAEEEEAEQGEPIADGISFYNELKISQKLNSQDVELFRSSLINGCGVELHEFVDRKIKITHHDPKFWSFLFDENDKLTLAIRRLKFAKGAFLNGEILQEEMEIMSVWDETDIVDYQYSGEAWRMIDTRPHFYGRIPIVVWKIDDDGDALISDDLMSLNDEYNEAYSASGDDLKSETDAKLKISGHDSNWVMENAAKIKELGVIPVPSDGDASYVTKGGAVDRFGDHLERTRDHIHTGFKIPDIHSIVGAVGATSGIALQLKFQPMQQHSAAMRNFIRQAIRERIELINTRSSKTSRALIEEFSVTVQFVVPVNRIEEWQNIKSLDGEVSHITRLKLLSDIDDPQSEMENLQREGFDRIGPEGAVQEQEELTAEAERQIKESVAVAIQAVADEAVALVNSSGAVKRLIAEQEAKASGTPTEQ